MKSKIIRLVDYKTIPIDPEIYVEGIDQDVEADIQHLVRKDKKRISADTVELKDIVSLQAVSKNPKYNHQNLMLNVGAHMMPAELEDQLIGLGVNTPTVLRVKDDEVTVTVKSVTRTVYPPLTDAYVKSWAASEDGERSVQTAEDFRKYMYEKHFQEKKEDALFSAALRLMEQVYEQSEFALDEQELKELQDTVLQEMDQDLKKVGKSWETLTEKDYSAYFGVSNHEEFLESVSYSVLEQYVQQLLACQYANVPTDKVDVNDEPPMNVYSLYKDYVASVTTVQVK